MTAFLFFFGIQSLSKARSLSSGFNLHNSLADSALFAHVSNVLSWAAFCHFFFPISEKGFFTCPPTKKTF